MKWLVVVSLNFIVSMRLFRHLSARQIKAPNKLHVIGTYKFKSNRRFITLRNVAKCICGKKRRRKKSMCNMCDLIANVIKMNNWSATNFDEWQSTQSTWAVNESSLQMIIVSWTMQAIIDISYILAALAIWFLLFLLNAHK